MAGSEDQSWSTAVRRGVACLFRMQQDGHWHGFPTLAGNSDVWVTAFVVTHLQKFSTRRAALAQARAYLAAAQRPGEGWSYGVDVPTDADSTAWCLMALRRKRQMAPTAIRTAREFLAAHQSEQGTATYIEDGGIRGYINASPSVSLAGWSAPHADVTAAALLAGVPSLQTRRGLATLSRLVFQQSGAGLWDAYWWRGPFYTTTLVLRAVGSAGYRLPRPQAARLLAALEREQLPDGGFGLGASLASDPFTTALALECYFHLAYLGGAEGRQAASRALVNQQREDGGWQGDYIMRIPAPDVVEPRHISGWKRGTGGGNSYVLDEGGVFATTLASAALAMVQGLDNALEDRPELRVLHEPVADETVITLNR